MKNNIKKYIEQIIVFIIIAIVTLLGISCWYIMRLEQQIIERDNLINKLTFSENLVKEYFDIQYDSVTDRTSYVLKNSKREIIQHVLNHQSTFIYGNDTISDTEFVKLFNQKINNYNDLVHKYNKLALHRDSITDYNKALQTGVKMIEEKYNISLIIKPDSNVYHIRLIPSTQIDSAMLLLPYYRNRIEYDSTNRVWNITNPPLINEQLSTLEKLFKLVR